MSKLKVMDTKGAAVGEITLADGLLVLDRGDKAVHDAVLAYLAAQRAGSASTKRKGEVAGSNKKPWRQKGTGRARAGHRQSPVWRGGGVAFGPHPRAYNVKVNKKVGQLALRRAVGARVEDGGWKVVDALAMEAGKTRAFAALLKALGVKAPALILVDQPDVKAVLASRNIPGIEMMRAQDVHVYHVVRYPTVVATKAAMAVLEQRLAAGVKGAA